MKRLSGLRRLAAAHGPWLAIAVVAVGVHVAAAPVMRSAGEKRRVEAFDRAGQSWADVRRCLVGERLAESETVFERVRAIEVGLAHERSDAPLAERWSLSPSGWPGRCAPWVAKLYDALVPVDRDLAAHALLLRERLQRPSSLAAARDSIVALATSGPDDAEPDPHVPAAPPPAQARLHWPAQPMADARLLAVVEDTVRGDGLRVAIPGSAARRVCDFVDRDGAAFAVARCELVPGASPGRVGLASARRSETAFLWSATGAWLDGASVPLPDEARVAAAATLDDGSAAFIAGRSLSGTGGGVLYGWRAGVTSLPQPLDGCTGAGEEVLLLPDGVVLRKCIDRELAVSRLGKPAAPSKIGQTGRASWDFDPPLACATTGGFAVAMPGADPGASSKLALPDGDRWVVHELGAPADAMVCQGDEVTVTGVAETSKSVFAVIVDRCTRAGCAATRIPVDDFVPADIRPREKRDLAATVLGDRLLVVWNTGHYGLRMRLAPVAQFRDDGAARDELLEYGPFRSSTIGFGVFGRPKGAVLLVERSEGVAAFRIAPDGETAAVAVERVL